MKTKIIDEENKKYIEECKKTIAEIEKIHDETVQYYNEKDQKDLFRMFHTEAKKILRFFSLFEEFEKGYFERSFHELLADNHDFVWDVLPQNYEKCYIDPAYSAKIFGREKGRVIAFFNIMLRQFKNFAFDLNALRMRNTANLFVSFYKAACTGAEHEELLDILKKQFKETMFENFVQGIRHSYMAEFNRAYAIVQESDLSDPRYLFRYGSYIGDNELKTWKFFREYPEDKLQKAAKLIADCYIKGFERENKSLEGKNTVTIHAPAGYERLLRLVIKEFGRYNMKTLLSSIPPVLNEQFSYDHKFNEALFLTEDFINSIADNYDRACNENKQLFESFSGNVMIEIFGKNPFSPRQKDEAVRLSNEQHALLRKKMNAMMTVSEKYNPREKTSFSIISFPAPEIGPAFEQIFEAIMEVNMLDAPKYESIQNTIISVLEKSTLVRVKGSNGNKTDMTVKIQDVENDNHTNFLNCGADLNIPVGEVYTSPVLKGTNGILHLEDTYLDGLRYIDLTFKFKDGYIEEYSCKNFDDEEQNKKYVHDNLFAGNESLPVGEFAIGTNTLAFVTAKKFDILNILPILIIEKSGPHFAIGDTCFMRVEDVSVYDFITGKEMIARENEKSALRHTDPEKAYTNCHTDITIPYDSIKIIESVEKNGNSTAIIQDGRFVLKGTEELNQAFDLM